MSLSHTLLFRFFFAMKTITSVRIPPCLAAAGIPAALASNLPDDLCVLVNSSSVDPPPSQLPPKRVGMGRRSDRQRPLHVSSSCAATHSSYQPSTLGTQTENTFSEQWKRTGQGHVNGKKTDSALVDDGTRWDEMSCCFTQCRFFLSFVFSIVNAQSSTTNN